MTTTEGIPEDGSLREEGMVQEERWQEIHRLGAAQVSVSEIARTLALDRKTPGKATGQIALDTLDMGWIGEGILGGVQDGATGDLSSQPVVQPAWSGFDVAVDLGAFRPRPLDEVRRGRGGSGMALAHRGDLGLVPGRGARLVGPRSRVQSAAVAASALAASSLSSKIGSRRICV